MENFCPTNRSYDAKSRDAAENASAADEPANTELHLYGFVPDSIVDGPGLRCVVFVQGCSHGCPGCHNPESQPTEGGEVRTVADILTEIRANRLVHAVTLSGGEPFEQPQGCAMLAESLKQHGYNIWTYTGYLFEDLKRLAESDAAVRKLLENTDVLVDGPFIQAQHSYDLKWRGSKNQRLIDVEKSFAAGNAIIWHQESYAPDPPPSW